VASGAGGDIRCGDWEFYSYKLEVFVFCDPPCHEAGAEGEVGVPRYKHHHNNQVQRPEERGLTRRKRLSGHQSFAPISIMTGNSTCEAISPIRACGES
jgi:hypothetical protein